MDTTHAIIAQVSSLSYLGIFILALLANFVVPVPEEVILLSIGYVLGMGKLSWVGVLVIVFAGLFISDMVLYELSYRGNRFVVLIYEKYFSKLVPFTEQFIRTHIRKIVVVSRFLVQLRFLSPFFAGYTKMDRRKYMLFDSLALIVYVPLYLFIGFYFRNRFEDIVSGIGEFKNILLILIALVLLFGITKTVKEFFLGRYRFSFKPHTDYRKTWFPGIQRKITPTHAFHVKK